MAETTDPRTVPAPPAAPVAESPRVRIPSPEMDQLRAHAASLQSIRQAVIDLTAGRPDTHMMTVGELRAAVIAPPAAGVPLPVTWSGDLVGPTGGGPRAQTLLPLVTSYGTAALLAVDDEERARLAGKLAATLHPAEACTTPGCGATETELDLYADDDDHHLAGWIAVRVSGTDGPTRWWCSLACATSAIVAGGAELADVDRTAAATPVPGPAEDDVLARCHRCGCTEERACPGGCAWVSGLMIDLCSACVRPAAQGDGFYRPCGCPVLLNRHLDGCEGTPLTAHDVAGGAAGGVR
ncbi:hypothetical protein [Streptomyces niveus]|uniref:hypothetical protein n=1 Tax=Streptomyces niveus TaxID=193462 RepID=UPI00367D1548